MLFVLFEQGAYVCVQVGSQFVQQFYTVLHTSPKYLHRFYTDASTLTHADAGRDGGEPAEVHGQEVSRGAWLRWLCFLHRFYLLCSPAR